MRSLDLDLLRTFVAIADRESFALAAEQVHRTQSAVTQQMARLEAQLGVTLFQKVGRSKRLSEHGVRLLEHARRLLVLNDEALEALLASDLRGPLRIGSTSPMVWMAAAEYVHDPSQPVPLMLPNEPSGYRAAAIATLDARGIAWRIRHVSTSLAFSGVRAALRAGLGVTVRTIEMLDPGLRVLSDAEGLPRLPDIGHDLYLRDERVSPPARRLFESVSEGRFRQPVRVRRPRDKRRGK